MTDAPNNLNRDTPPKKRKTRESFGSIRKSSSKRFIASYSGPDGKRYNGPKTFATTSEARFWLARIRVLLDSGKWNVASASDDGEAKAGRAEVLGPYALKWIGARVKADGGSLAPRTRKSYEDMVRRIFPPLSEQRIAFITPSDVRDWNTAQRATGKLTQSSRAYSLLSSILQQAVDDGIIQVSPCKIKGAGNAVTGIEVKPPTAAELKIIMETIDPRFKTMVVLASWAALRFGEITELRRKDIVAIEEGTPKKPHTTIYVDVSRGVTHVASEGFVLRPPKSRAGIRVVPLPPHVNEIILDHLRDNVGEDPESLIYESMTGGSHLGASTFYDYWYPAREAANRPDLHFHGLRHFSATAFALSGATIKELQDRLGHTTANVAMRYQHTTGRSAELAAKMSEQFAEGERTRKGKNKDKKKSKGKVKHKDKDKDKGRGKNKGAGQQV